jgi:hypothetical protein
MGILEHHLLVLLHVVLLDNMLLALPVLWGHAAVAQLLLLLLMELLCKLLDFPALLHVVVHGVVHWAAQTTVITAGGLSRPLVTTQATTPTGRCNSSSGSWSIDQRLVAANLLLLFGFAAALSSGIYIRLIGFPFLWDML